MARNSAKTPPTRDLSEDELERAVRGLELTHPEYVVRMVRLPDGTMARAFPRRGPAFQGRSAAIPPDELAVRWAEAVARIKSRVGPGGRVTASALAAELRVSVRTIERYRRTLSLG